MIDWHSHILPGIDDGSQSVSESVSLLRRLRSQGVRTVIATPHFYPNERSVSSFLEKRADSFEKLKESLPKRAPEIILGAEVYYYSGISRMDDLKLLRVQNSRVLLLEMPMTQWTDYTIKEIVDIAGSRDFTVMLAHVERYMDLQQPETLERLCENGLLMQVNASFFNGFFTKYKAIKLLKKGLIQFVGSDCHNMKNRPPQLDGAFELIQKKLGDDFLSEMDEFGKSLLISK